MSKILRSTCLIPRPMNVLPCICSPFRWLTLVSKGSERLQALCSAAELTVQQTVEYWTRTFWTAGVPEPDLCSRYIIAHVLGAKTMADLEAGRLNECLSQIQRERVWELCQRRLSRMPVQYVIEEWDFRNITLKTQPPVFIPRPETEDLVGLVLSDLQPRRGSSLTALEVGCGSGAVSLSLLQVLPQLQVIALDRSQEAVCLTRENADRLGLKDRLKVLHMDIILDADKVLKQCGPVDVLVSNPPYLFSQDITSLQPEILQFEDLAALDGGVDGLQVIKHILALAPLLLKNNGTVYLEVEPRHPPLVQQYVEQNSTCGLRYLQTHKDITQRPRFSVLQRQPAKC